MAGKHIALACSPETSRKLYSGLRAMGAQVRQLPVIAIRESDNKEALDAALTKLNEYDWIIFTSSYAALFFLRRLNELGLRTETLRGKNVCAVGPGTAAALAKAGIDVSLMPATFVAEGVLNALLDRQGGPNGLAGLRILFPRAREAREILPRALCEAGALVELIVCYETVEGAISPEDVAALLGRPPDLIVFTSSSTVRNFLSILGDHDGKRLMRESTVAVLGPITAGTVESFGKVPEILPRENTVPALLDAIREYFCRSQSR